jgi:5'-3' exonuclease
MHKKQSPFHNGDTLITVDTSYLIFHRFHATLSYWNRQGKSHIENESLTDEFILMMKKKMYETLNNLKREFKNSKFLFALDCPKKKIWRNDFKNDYKANRTYKQGTGQAMEIMINYIKQLYPEHIVSIDSVEADDIIAISTITSNYPKILIISGDNDFCQLINSKISLRKLEKTKTIEKEKPDNCLLIKIIMGDKSDNIPPIKYGIGSKKAEMYATNPELLNELLSNDENVQKQFNLNKKLIDFTQIPENFKDNIMNNVSKIITYIPVESNAIGKESILKNQQCLDGWMIPKKTYKPR